VWTYTRTSFTTLWFAGLISHNYKPAIYTHLKPGLLIPSFWLDLFVAFASYPRRCSAVETPNPNHRRQLWNATSSNSRGSLQPRSIMKLSDSSLLKDSRSFPHSISRIQRVPAVLKQGTDLRSRDHYSVIISHNFRELVNHIKITEHPHEYFLIANQSSDTKVYPRMLLRFRKCPNYSEVSRVKGFCPIPQHYLVSRPMQIIKMPDSSA
jgi:hypothetical protein